MGSLQLKVRCKSLEIDTKLEVPIFAMVLLIQLLLQLFELL